MPTYLCMTGAGALDDRKRAEIARLISAAHHDATGAPAFFVQVVFEEKPAGRRFLGGQTVEDHVWVRGDIRSGRPIEIRTRLMLAIMEGVAAILSLQTTDVWVYLNELAPTDMVEYGHVLPAPGEEAAWFAALPQSLQDYLEGLGTTERTFKL